MTAERPMVDTPLGRYCGVLMLNPNAHLDDLVNEPRETLDVEVKEWLDLTDNDHRAMIAKEVIALANHGGGFLVIGFQEGADGTFQPSAGRPVNLDAWSQDGIQSIVAKYTDPGLECRVLHRVSATSGEKHPIIAVPGGHRVPIRAKAGAPGGKKLVAHRVYIRRPGPASEEPKTAEEWDRFWSVSAKQASRTARSDALDNGRSRPKPWTGNCRCCEQFCESQHHHHAS